jgi:hypothetical protein
LNGQFAAFGLQDFSFMRAHFAGFCPDARNLNLQARNLFFDFLAQRFDFYWRCQMFSFESFFDSLGGSFGANSVFSDFFQFSFQVRHIFLMKPDDEPQHVSAFHADRWVGIFIKIEETAVHRILIEIAIPEKVTKTKPHKIGILAGPSLAHARRFNTG